MNARNDRSTPIALVTGGAVRIGRALALALAGDGLNVVIHCHHNRAAAGETAQRIRDLGRRAWTVSGALDGPDAAEAVLREAIAQAGRIDVLLNNAAVFSQGTLAETTAAACDAAWRVNALAPILLTQAFASHIRERGPETRGVVINLLDQRIVGRPTGTLAYTLSKQALAGFTRLAAAELAPQIRVNAIAPGPVLPPPAGAPREPAGAIPLGRRPTEQDVADAALYLIRAQAVTGQILFVDGGQHLAGG
ncbi:MAG: SDR family oxidoreductase [Lentisphaerae bacterium]|nr:SDR family oxidoreductase [Lentisphaerota bacterium]